MADILDIGRAVSAGAERNSNKVGLKSGLEADIIIFPGVRYDRVSEAETKTPRKKRTGRKSTRPSTRS